MGQAQVLRDHHELSISGAVFVCGKFHLNQIMARIHLAIANPVEAFDELSWRKSWQRFGPLTLTVLAGHVLVLGMLLQGDEVWRRGWAQVQAWVGADADPAMDSTSPQGSARSTSSQYKLENVLKRPAAQVPHQALVWQARLAEQAEVVKPKAPERKTAASKTAERKTEKPKVEEPKTEETQIGVAKTRVQQQAEVASSQGQASPPPAPAAAEALAAAEPMVERASERVSESVVAQPTSAALQSSASSSPPSSSPSSQLTAQLVTDTSGWPVQVPAPVRLKYDVLGEVKGFNYNVSGELLWTVSGDQYDAKLEIRAFLLGSRTQTSRGRLTAQGLEPKRFGDKVRSEVAAHFEYDQRQVIFSANTPRADLLPGAQDHLSVFVQLASWVQANPKGFAEGSVIELQAVGPRDALPWRFTVQGMERLKLPGGDIDALKLTRPPARPFDLSAEVWLAPSLGYLPARIKLIQDNGDFVDQQWVSSSAP
jgi:hypothetical protein